MRWPPEMLKQFVSGLFARPGTDATTYEEGGAKVAHREECEDFNLWSGVLQDSGEEM